MPAAFKTQEERDPRAVGKCAQENAGELLPNVPTNVTNITVNYILHATTEENLHLS